MVLHTDEPHPHVHVVVKAVSEDGVRLNIRKDTLRVWRQEFARHLRALALEANATPRAVRGENHTRKLDTIYRTQLRGDSRHVRERVNAVAAAMIRGDKLVEPARTRLEETRRQVKHGWLAIREALIANGYPALAERVREFVSQIASPGSEREHIAERLRRQLQRETRSPERSR